MDIWEEFGRDGEAALRTLCDQNVRESQRLECKRKSSPERTALSDDDKRGIGETLSAMSNAEGGVLIFGMLCEKSGDGQDCAKAPQACISVRSLAATIRSLVTDYLSPPNADIEVRAVEASAVPDTGVVTIRVGASSFW